MGNVRPLAQKMAAAGYRVFIHDRRNCGKSDISFDGSQSEYEVWVDDLHALLAHFNALPAVIGGGSSGGRLAMLFALRYPRDTRALLLWRVTGGPFAAKRLAEQYYSQYIRLAEQGGMDAIAKSEHFAERIAQNPANREKLMALSTDEFIAVMKSWREYFNKGADLPVIGATERDLNSIRVADDHHSGQRPHPFARDRRGGASDDPGQRIVRSVAGRSRYRSVSGGGLGDEGGRTGRRRSRAFLSRVKIAA